LPCRDNRRRKQNPGDNTNRPEASPDHCADLTISKALISGTTDGVSDTAIRCPSDDGDNCRSQVCEHIQFELDSCLLVSSNRRRYVVDMGEHIAAHNTDRRLVGRKQSRKQTPEAIGRKLLDVVVYSKRCRIGNKLTVDDLAETSEVGDWKMPDFRIACSYAASQGWLDIDGDTLTLTAAGLGAA
jgi:hypothetical protein